MEDQFYNEVENWISEISDDKSFTSEIVAINFGLFESEDGCMTYCIGSKIYDRENDEWACNEDFIPQNKYLKIPNRLTENKNWQEIQNMFSEILQKYISSLDYEFSLLNKVKAITCGFDEGDLQKIK
jgi:predicted transcriptional regulator YdeE